MNQKIYEEYFMFIKEKKSILNKYATNTGNSVPKNKKKNLLDLKQHIDTQHGNNR